MKLYRPTGESTRHRLRRYLWGILLMILILVLALWASLWWLLALPLAFDYYFLRLIPWGWGRNSSNPIVRFLATWVGDFIFIVVLVSVLQTFLFQNFGIPSSSLEKTMLVGDYLVVEKLSYGPRMPMTPVAMPLVHESFLGMKAYLDKPSCPYRRLKGLRQIERNDLVVFNFPAGDTVALSVSIPDYYTLCAQYGREAVHRDRATFGEIIYRPVDKRAHYIKRCVGLPGERIEIRDNQVLIDGKTIGNPSKMQLNYLLQTDGRTLSKEVLDALKINYRDVNEISMQIHSQKEAEALELELGLTPIDSTLSMGRIYELPLTQAMREQLTREPYVRNIVVERSRDRGVCYPLSKDFAWTGDNYGPLLIPKAGLTIELNEHNLALYRRCIEAYEGHRLETTPEGRVLVDGVEQRSYTFAMDYYFMLGDNRHNSADSRYWGFVPEDHIVGRPLFIFFSRNDEQGFLSGIRWGRMFRAVDAD